MARLRTIQGYVTVVPSNRIIASSAAIVTINNVATLTKKKEIVITQAGTYRVSYNIYHEAIAGNQSAQAQIFKNGTAFGLLRTNSSSPNVYDLYTEDVGPWEAGDLLQLYISMNAVDNFNALNLTVRGELFQGTAPVPAGAKNLE